MCADHVDAAAARRLRFAAAGLVAFLVLLLAALAYQQLYRAAHHSARERHQNQRLILEPAPRGNIYDRTGRVLAGNRARTAAVIWPGELRDEFRREWESQTSAAAGKSPDPASVRATVVQRYADKVTELVGRRATVDRARLEQVFARDRTQSVVLINDLTPEEASRLAAQLPPSGPWRLQTTYERHYPHGRTASHLLGRVRTEVLRQPNRDQLIALNYRGAVGESGVERQFESQLQGRPGEAVSYLDALGFRVDNPLEYRPPIAGTDLTLSVDLDLQKVMELTMRGTSGATRGAAVALAVNTGEVLALVSLPDFDLAEVSPELSAATKQRIDAASGWLNRATHGLYPPGSSFKIFTALAALRQGTLHADTILSCPGFLDVAGNRFPCHRADGHGDLALVRALAQSCNVFAYQIGLAAGPNALAAEARRFHFDAPTGIELPTETTAMLVADPAWKRAQGRGDWSPIDTANFAIGQGFLRITPLQAACAVASFARGEALTVPTLLRSPGRRASGARPPEPLQLAPELRAAVIEGMRAVVERGIGADAQVPGLSIAGKTGTAQIVRPGGMQNVAWFVAFAPVERPEIAVAIALEGDELDAEYAGAKHAAPVVREVLAAYFEKRTPKSGGTP